MSELVPWFADRVAKFREHGFPITDEAAATVENLSPVPLEDGGIQVELHAGGVDLEVLVNAAGQVEDVYLHRATNSHNPSTPASRGVEGGDAT